MPKLGMPPRTAHRQRGSVLDALFSRTQQRMYGLLFGQPQRSFTITELIRLTKSGSGAVQRELKKLLAAGLVHREEQGRQKLYRANCDAFIFPALHDLVQKTSGIAGTLREALLPVAEHVDLAILYGSIAKQTDNALSDIDVLIVSDTLTLSNAFGAFEVAEKRLGRRVSPTMYTSAEFRNQKKDPFLRKVLGGDHVILLGDKDGEVSAR